jgi:hypothetical protein
MGRCLRSDPMLERVCVSLDLNERDLKHRVARNRMKFKFGVLHGPSRQWILRLLLLALSCCKHGK